MKNYDAEFKILSAQKNDKTEIYEKHKTAIDVILIALDSNYKDSDERAKVLTEYFGSADVVIIQLAKLQMQCCIFDDRLVYIFDNPEVSQDAKEQLIEMCCDIFVITSLFDLKYQIVNHRDFCRTLEITLNDCIYSILCKLHKSNKNCFVA
ncbi:TPA: hypothetical protein JFP82_002133 [Vibrio cholerae O1]|uniref:hypothetical protein n=1 Tax=Vibrio cholerae TaxID=666 RepID=UPI001A34419A|nr:hypothetical protein [Vibrio cholerae]HAU9839329.1 hypothetical protein [Vibrio cholerae O1]HDI3136566.1 hypothetical protein [Vibrio cholerae]